MRQGIFRKLLQAKMKTQDHQPLGYHYERSAEVDMLAVGQNICKKVKMICAGVNAVDKVERPLTGGECKRPVPSQGEPHGWYEIEYYRRLVTKSIACVFHTSLPKGSGLY
jgi:hypothetical protein